MGFFFVSVSLVFVAISIPTDTIYTYIFFIGVHQSVSIYLSGMCPEDGETGSSGMGVGQIPRHLLFLGTCTLIAQGNQGSGATCLRSHGEWVRELPFEMRLAGPQRPSSFCSNRLLMELEREMSSSRKSARLPSCLSLVWLLHVSHCGIFCG